MKKYCSLLLSLLFVSTISAQETYPAKVVDGPNFAKDLFYLNQQKMVSQVPHLKSLDIKFGTASWYWTTNPTAAASTTYINVDLDPINYLGFIMEMPGGGERIVTLKDAGITPTDYNIVVIKLDIEFGTINARGNSEVNLNGTFKQLSTGTGALFFNTPEDYDKFSKFINEKKFKTTQEIFSALSPQVTIKYLGSFNGNILSENNTFLLRQIEKYIQNVWKDAEKRAKINTLIADAQNAESLGRVDEAIKKYKEAYAISQDPKIQKDIERVSAKNQTYNSGQKTRTTRTGSNTNQNTSSSRIDNTQNNTNSRNDALVLQGNNIVKQSQALERTIYSGANKITELLQQGIDQRNREAEARAIQEEREWEAERRRKRQQHIEADRRAEQYRKEQEELKRKRNLSIEEAYQKKGGDANFNAKLKDFERSATDVMTYINSYLTKNGSTFQTLNYLDNCSYVKVIEAIQINDRLNNIGKVTLIEELVALKNAYTDFYMSNAKQRDEYYDNTYNSGCNQYLKTVAYSLSIRYRFNSEPSGSISNTDTDLIVAYKKNVSARLSSSVFVKYASRFKATHTYGEIYFGLGDYLDFYLNKSWIDYGTNPPERARQLFVERPNEAKKVKLTHKIGRTYNAIEDVDELTMAIFNYNHGFFDDAFNNYKTYKLKIADKKIVESDVRNLISEPVISQILGTILYIDNKDYEQALILLKRLREFHLPILKKSLSKEKVKALDLAILKLENIVFYESGNYSKMWLPKNKNYFKGGKSRTSNYHLLEYNNPGLLADALYKTGHKDFAEDIIDFIVDYHKKIFKFKSKYRGTKADVDAFKRMLEVFRPKVLKKMTFSVEHKYQFGNYWEYDKLLRWKLYPDYGDQINNTPVYLKNENDWINHKDHIGKLLPQQKLNSVFNEQLSIYNKGKLDISDESKSFLFSLVQLGIWSGNFYEVMPAMWDLKTHYNLKESILYEKILVLMTSFKEDLSDHRYDRDENGNKRWAGAEYENLTIEWFIKNGKNPDIKNQMNDILKIWSNYDYSHFLIPFLYEL